MDKKNGIYYENKYHSLFFADTFLNQAKRKKVLL